MSKFLPLTFAFLILFHPQDLSATNTSTVPAVETYKQLVTAIRQVRSESRLRIEQAVEQEKVREAWQTGKLIDEHVLQHKDRADYGKQVLVRLAKDLGTSQTELSFMLQFARAYPIDSPANKLSWAHYRELLSFNDSKERDEIAAQAAREGWGRDRVRQEVYRRQASKRPAEEIFSMILTAKPGKLQTYRIVRAQAGKYKGQLVIDLGFSNYYRPEQKLRFEEGDIVQVVKGKLKKLDGGSEADRYMYEADIFKVIDADTFTAVIDLGFGFNTVQKLRLRGLDAPEMESAEGKEAKEFLEHQLSFPRSQVLIRTSKSDKYDRYLADLFVDGEYVNQKLVERGFATIVED